MVMRVLLKILFVVLCFPGSSYGKESTCNAGDPGLIPGSGRSPGEGPGNPLQYSCLENPLDGAALAGYSPWARKESDTTERLTLSLSPGSSAGKESAGNAGDPSLTPGSERSTGEGIGYPFQ